MNDRLSWNDFNMLLAFLASTRSPDLSTQHGAYIIDSKNRQIGMGYNGFPRNCDDTKMPQTRPEKYDVIIHAERNAIYNANKNLEGSILYVTGFPCVRCWCDIIQNGITKVIYGTVKSKNEKSPHVDDDPNNNLINLMLLNNNIIIEKWKPDNIGLIKAKVNKMLGLMLDEGV